MDTTKSPADRGKCQQGLKMSEISINLSVERPLDSSPIRGAFGKQGKFKSTAKASPIRGGGIPKG